MLNSEDSSRIYQQAYLPEHLPGYVECISGARPHLLGNYLCFIRKTHLIFIGYPLGVPSDDAPGAYRSACERFDPSTVALIAPDIWLDSAEVEMQPEDNYYRLDLPLKSIHSEVAYMVRRAEKELEVKYGRFGAEHKKLIKKFIQNHDLTAAQIQIFKHVGNYAKRSKTARLIEARRADRLAAFTIVDMGSAEHAFYLFNFRSPKMLVPGASDLLFNEMVSLAQSEGKNAINLGLGIHAGIRKFKEKWGGVAFLPHRSAFVYRKQSAGPELGELADKL
jgi:predicted DNA-binding WGR domain protein